MSRLDEAIKAYQEALKINPDHVDAITNLGVAFWSKGLVDKAHRAFQEALKIKPDHSDAIHNLMALKKINKKTNTNVFDAATKGEIKVVKEAIESGFDVNSSNADSTPLLHMPITGRLFFLFCGKSNSKKEREMAAVTRFFPEYRSEFFLFEPRGTGKST